MFTKSLLFLPLAGLLAACSSANPDAVAHLAITVTLRQPQPVSACFKPTSAFHVDTKASTEKVLKVTTKVAPGPVFDVTQVNPNIVQVALVSTSKDKGSEDGKRNLAALRGLTEELAACGNGAPTPAP